MNKLILLFISAVLISGCMSTVTETSHNSYRIETIEFPHSLEADGFVYAEMEWMKRAEQVCKDKKVIGKPKYRNTDNGVTVEHDEATAEKKWIVAYGEVTCVSKQS